MKLLRTDIAELFEAEIKLLRESDLKNNRGSFLFDWRADNLNQVYVIKPVESTRVLGLISLMDLPEELRVHVQLIEASVENVGRKKEIENIPGCLIAFACERSYEKGYEGFVSLFPKTELIDHYIDNYGFRQYGRMLAVEGLFAEKLILKFLYNEL